MMNILCSAVVVGGGYYNVFELSSFELLSGWRQCGGSALAARWRQRSGGGQHGGGVGSAAVVAAERWQRTGGSSAAMAAWRW
jgi:hypothetical protein